MVRIYSQQIFVHCRAFNDLRESFTTPASGNTITTSNQAVNNQVTNNQLTIASEENRPDSTSMDTQGITDTNTKDPNGILEETVDMETETTNSTTPELKQDVSMDSKELNDHAQRAAQSGSCNRGHIFVEPSWLDDTEPIPPEQLAALYVTKQDFEVSIIFIWIIPPWNNYDQHLPGGIKGGRELFEYKFRYLPRGDKVSMLTHTYPHKPLRKIKVTTYNHQADSRLYVWPDVWSGDLQV